MKQETMKVAGTREVLGKEFNFYGTWEQPMFLAKDVAERIENSNTSQMINIVDEDEKALYTMYRVDGSTNKQWFLTEQGLYEVCMLSRKPIAKEMKREIKTILKEIRLNGGYISDKATDKQVVEIVKNHYLSKYCTDDIHDRKSVRNYIRQSDLMKLDQTVQEIIDIVVPMKGSIKNEIIDTAIKELKKIDAERYMDSAKNTFIKTVAKDSVIVLQDVKIGKKVRRINTLEYRIGVGA